MKEVELNYIEINGVNYPVHCDLNVLDVLQDKYGSVNQFERDLLGLTPVFDDNGEVKHDETGAIVKTHGEPRVRAVIDALYYMVREGQKIDTRQSGREWEELTVDEIREICGIPFNKLAVILHDQVNICFDVKKKSEKPTTTRKSRRRNSTT